MNKTLNLVVILTLTCVIAALSMALADRLTEGRIDTQKKMEKVSSIKNILPPFDNDPLADKKEIDGETFYIGKKAGKLTGIALEVEGEGYSGGIRIMVGIDPTGTITGVEILEQLETPGLGARIEDDTFRAQFKGKSLTNSKLVEGHLAVKKDNGDIDALTGATVSSRGVTEAVDKALNIFQQYKDKLTQ